MRKFAIIGIAFLLVVSIAYAGVLNYYGKIVGNVNVQGPIFYADFSQNKLLINAKPSQSSQVSFSDSNSKFIFSDDIGGVNFSYQIKCEFSTKAWSDSENQILRLYCRYYDTSWHDLCYIDVTVSQIPNVITTSCNSSLTSITNVHRFGYKFEGQSVGDVTYYIESNSDGDTRFQVSKA
jgi:hypothetical protein